MVAPTENSDFVPLKDPAKTFLDDAAVDRGVQWALREARIMHKKLGFPMVGLCDGQFVRIAPEDIQIDQPENQS